MFNYTSHIALFYFVEQDSGNIRHITELDAVRQNAVGTANVSSRQTHRLFGRKVLRRKLSRLHSNLARDLAGLDIAGMLEEFAVLARQQALARSKGFL